MTRYTSNTLLALAGLLAMAAALTFVMPKGTTPLQDWEEDVFGDREQCTVLFVGPSYVKRVEPRFFNAESKRLRTNHRACKLGRASLTGVELEHELDKLLAGNWPKLKLVVVDITLGDTLKFDPGNWFKRRVIEWHTFDSALRSRRYYPLDASWTQLFEYAPQLWAHAKHLMLNYLEVGNGAMFVSELTSHPERGTKTKHPKRTHKQYLKYVRDLRNAKRAHRDAPIYGDNTWPLSLRRRIRAHGYEAAFLFAPVWEEARIPSRAVEGKDRLRVMDFGDPDKYPEFYTKRARGVTTHLTRRAAKRYSQRLAQHIAKFEPGEKRVARKKRGTKSAHPKHPKSKQKNKKQSKAKPKLASNNKRSAKEQRHDGKPTKGAKQ